MHRKNETNCLKMRCGRRGYCGNLQGGMDSAGQYIVPQSFHGAILDHVGHLRYEC